MSDHGGHIGCRRPALVDDEIGVAVRNPRIPDLEALQTGPFDEAAGAFVTGVLECRAPGGLANRLSRKALSHELLHQALGSCVHIGLDGEPGPADDRIGVRDSATIDNLQTAGSVLKAQFIDVEKAGLPGRIKNFGSYQGAGTSPWWAPASFTMPAPTVPGMATPHSRPASP